jgi:hypothetical protein
MKKHLESLLSIVLLLALSITTIFAQEEFYKELKESSDLVIEGRITKSEGKWNESRTVIFTEHEVLVSKVFKGEVRSNTIILVTPGGVADNQFMFGTHLLDLQAGMKGVFFAQSEAFDGFSKRDTSSNSIFFAKRLGSFYPKNYADSTIPLGYGTLKAKEDYERFLNVIGTPIYEYDEEAETAAFAFDCSDLTTETLAEVSFRNFEVSGDLESIEFDLVIQANPEGLKLGKCEYKISFPDSVFGSFLVQNSLVEITKGDLIDDNNDFQLTTTDAAADKLKIVVEHTGGLFNEAVLQDEEIQLLHCKFEIANPLLLAELEATDFEIEGNIWYQCRGRLEPFDKIAFETGLDGVAGFGSAGINYTLQKFSFRTQGTLEILSFDIYASSTEARQLNTVELYINYGNSAFGTFIEANNRVSFTGPAGYLSELSDAESNVLKIELAEASMPNTPPLIIGLEPIKLATVSMLAQDCSSLANIEWNGLTNNVNHTYFEDGEIMIYTSVSFEGGLTSPMCGCTLPSPNDPEIKSFSVDFTKDKIRAGTGEVLKIFGENFGDVIVNGSCYIEVENADHSFPVPNPGWSNANRTRIPLGDIINWTNNEITFVVPSTTLGDISAPVESGDLIVFNECGESNDKNIDVEYAVLNVRQGTTAHRVALEKQTEDGIEFSFASNVGTFERDLARYAVNTWCNQTNIGWSVLDGNASANSIDPGDQINLILEVDPENSPFISGSTEAGVIVFGQVAPNENFTTSCSSADQGEIYYVQNIDVVINENTNFSNMDLGTSRRIFLHEFGHAHLLEHASRLFGSGDPQKLMYYTSGNQNNSITSADGNGAISVFPASLELLGSNSSDNCPNAVVMMGCPNKTEDIFDGSEIVLSPNPFDDNLLIDLNEIDNEDLVIEIFSLAGNSLLRRKVNSGQTVKLSNLDFLPSGMYLLHIHNSSFEWIGKIVKK